MDIYNACCKTSPVKGHRAYNIAHNQLVYIHLQMTRGRQESLELSGIVVVSWENIVPISCVKEAQKNMSSQNDTLRNCCMREEKFQGPEVYYTLRDNTVSEVSTIIIDCWSGALKEVL